METAKERYENHGWFAVCFVVRGSGSIRTNYLAYRNRYRPDRGSDSQRNHHPRQPETGTQREVVADNQGRYTIQQLTPGKYKLTAKAAGFADVVVENVELLVNQPATMPIMFVKVGATDDFRAGGGRRRAGEYHRRFAGQRDQQHSHHRNADVRAQRGGPAGVSAGRHELQFIRRVGRRCGRADYRSGAVNGGKPDQGNITLDGADVNDQNARTAFTSVLRVTLDSVEEFRTTTTNGDAATGRGSGADVMLVTKSGTNAFHGTLV